MIDSNLVPNISSTAVLFDRETLQFTVKLLKPQNPSLALRIQNLIGPSARIHHQESEILSPEDTFKLCLDSFTLKRVVETLANAGQALAESAIQSHDGDHQELLNTKAAISKWLDYARYHQLQFEQQSRNQHSDSVTLQRKPT